MKLTLILLCFVSLAYAHRNYQSSIPNGHSVPNPCPSDGIWNAVGHQNVNHGGARNSFGQDFLAENKQWTKVLCKADSDGDGLSNGWELGDPHCTWPGQTAGKPVGHPGICDNAFDPGRCKAGSELSWAC